jgi:hypothetical protein
VSETRKVLNEGLCKQLIKRFLRRTHSGESANAVIRELMHEVYAQGYKAAEQDREKV